MYLLGVIEVLYSTCVSLTKRSIVLLGTGIALVCQPNLLHDVLRFLRINFYTILLVNKEMRDKVNGPFLSYSRFESSNELERDHAFQSRHFLNVQAKNSNLF